MAVSLLFNDLARGRQLHNNTNTMSTQKVTVWDGVKIGCGIFIVLPAIILAFIILLLGIPTCGAIGEARAKEKQRNEQKLKETTYE
jgi:hypothetical protein